LLQCSIRYSFAISFSIVIFFCCLWVTLATLSHDARPCKCIIRTSVKGIVLARPCGVVYIALV
jgi:RsiW-degrading membrane proteinase PrsW (M82 family)